MTSFLKDFKNSLNGVSFESAEVPQVDEPPRHEGPITQEDINDVKEHRDEVCEAVAAAKEIHSDAQQIGDVTRATDQVVAAVDKADHITKDQAETYVNLANLGIDDASHLLQSEIPRLEVQDSAVTAESMEGVMSWLASASKGV